MVKIYFFSVASLLSHGNHNNEECRTVKEKRERKAEKKVEGNREDGENDERVISNTYTT